MALGAGLAAACASHPPPPPAKVVELPPPPPPPVIPRPRPSPLLPEHKPTPPPEPGGRAPEEAAAASLPPPAPELPAPPAQSMAQSTAPAKAPPKDLIGLDQRKAVRLFGAATEKSEQPPATVWRWRSGTCELDLYFYLDLRSGQMRSLHYVFKGDATGQEDCLRSLAVAGRG